MSLYDGLGLDSKEKTQKNPKTNLEGWSSGIKLLQSQLQLKKAAFIQHGKKDQLKKGGTILPPVVDLKSRREDNDDPQPQILGYGQKTKAKTSNTSLLGGDWDISQEYDPQWPNDYEKIMRDRAEKERRIRDHDRNPDDKSGRYNDRYNKRGRYDRNFDRGQELDRPRDEEYEEEWPRKGPSAGATIAPPPSLLEPTDSTNPYNIPNTPFPTGSNVAAKIMAKYGFKEGQGLGRKEQGMCQALQVEKTSKRGGKIIHEKDLPKFDSPPYFQPPQTPPQHPVVSPTLTTQVDPITLIMKTPSKVVLLRNMVGPGEVDDDLELETKEECGKYGEVAKCVIFEIPGGNVTEEESVRIFIEFKRVEAAIKAVVDLNGRYFGGRIVKAGFYDVDKFKRLELAD